MLTQDAPHTTHKQRQIILGDLFGKAPPEAAKAEQLTIASMMMGNHEAGDVIALLGHTGEAFASQVNAIVYEAIVKCYQARRGVEIPIVAQALRDGGQFEIIGGTDCMMAYHEQLPSAASAMHYAKIVAEKATIRRVIAAAGKVLDDAYNSGMPGEEIQSRAAAHIFAACAKQADETAEDFSSIILRAHDDMLRTEPEAAGMGTGFKAIDSVIGGLRNGELIILAARPSMGKTALMTAIGAHLAQSAAVGIFSLEMGRDQIGRRILAAKAHVSERSPWRDTTEIMRMGNTAGILSQGLNMIVDDKPGITCSVLAIKARRMVERKGVKAILIDYLQLLREPGYKARHEEVSAMSRSLKELARELNIPIVCLAQLNRQVEGRSENRPRMSDLRESGAIEQDADIVALLHREAYYHKGDPQWEANNPGAMGRAELIVDKNRNGPTGIAEIQWKASWMAFEE